MPKTPTSTEGDALTTNIEPGLDTKRPAKKSAKVAKPAKAKAVKPAKSPAVKPSSKPSSKTSKPGKPAIGSGANTPGKPSPKPSKTASKGSATSTVKSAKPAKSSEGSTKTRKARVGITGLPHIHLIEQNGARFTPGYQVKVPTGTNGKLVSKWFGSGQKQFGSLDGAKKAAIKWRDEQLAAKK